MKVGKFHNKNIEKQKLLNFKLQGKTKKLKEGVDLLFVNQWPKI